MRALVFVTLLVLGGCSSGAAYEEDASSGGGDDAYFAQDSAHESGDSSVQDSGQASAE